jgi:protein gp37
MSLGDFWDNQVSDAWRTEVLEIIRQCRDLEWLILTTRPQNIVRALQVWRGATVENMIEAQRRIPILLRIPARIHWVSLGHGLNRLISGPGSVWHSNGLSWARRQARSPV